jgi:hypothetical protein
MTRNFRRLIYKIYGFVLPQKKQQNGMFNLCHTYDFLLWGGYVLDDRSWIHGSSSTFIFATSCVLILEYIHHVIPIGRTTASYFSPE